MKKYFLVVSVALLLTACTKTAPQIAPIATDTGSTPAVTTGSGYDDKEVQDTMKEIDKILSTDTGAQVTK